MRKTVYEIYLKALRDKRPITLEEIYPQVYKFIVRAGVSWSGPGEKVMYLGAPAEVMEALTLIEDDCD